MAASKRDLTTVNLFYNSLLSHIKSQSSAVQGYFDGFFIKLLGTEALFPSALSSLVQVFHPQNDKIAAGTAAIISKFQVEERRTRGKKWRKAMPL